MNPEQQDLFLKEIEELKEGEERRAIVNLNGMPYNVTWNREVGLFELWVMDLRGNVFEVGRCFTPILLLELLKVHCMAMLEEKNVMDKRVNQKTPRNGNGFGG